MLSSFAIVRSLNLEFYLKHWLKITLFAFLTTLSAQWLHAGESSSSGKNLFTESVQEEEFLSPDAAFKLDITQKDANNITANFKIVSGYYLYKQRISFKDANGQTLTAAMPAGDIKDDPNFGKQEVYHHDFSAEIPVKTAGEITINARYQGCSEKGLCYAPQTKTFKLNLNDINSDALQANNHAASGDTTLASAASNDEDSTTLALKTGNLWLVIAGFFVAGLLLSFTPCVLPMIPILSSIIVGSQSKQAQPSKLHAFGLSVAYVFGMALSYTLAGIAAGLSGSLISQSLQSPWILAFTALLFVVLAFSMFGFYELKLPSAFENKILNFSNKLKGGEFLGVFIMGVISALIVSPCVAAPLAGALIYIGQTHNVFLGGVGLFALALGMGVPLLLIGASAGSLLPKAGSWMTIVRNLFGVLMLLMASYILWPILPNSITQPVNKMLGLEAASHLPFQRVKSVAELDVAIAKAKGKTVMLDFYADWCTSCKEMEKYTFSDEKVKTALSNTILLQADVTENNDNDQALLKRFGLFGPPGIIFFDKSGAEIKTRVIGYKNADDFIQTLNLVTK
jgi:thioredoxin:protein disulfide reductase